MKINEIIIKLLLIMSLATLRLTRELAKLKKDKLDGIEVTETDDIMHWYAKIMGPPETPFEGGVFKLEFKFHSDYPVKPPSVKFLTNMFHPNIYRDGKICVDILQSEWTPAQNIRSILVSIRSLLMDPNPNSPANRDAAKLFVSNLEEYNNRVKKIINQTV